MLRAFFIFLLTGNVMAEYRVYQYVVKSKIKIATENQSHVVTSTLDPVSYIAYHGGENSIRVDLLRSWMCKGNTSNQRPICESPLDRAPIAFSQEK